MYPADISPKNLSKVLKFLKRDQGYIGGSVTTPFKEKAINFAILCLNYPRFAFGASNKKLEDLEPKCEEVFESKNFQIQEKIFIPDFLIFISKSNY